MRQTNRVEPINNNNSDQAIVITTLELDINRQVEVTPIKETIVPRPPSPVVRSFKLSRKLVGCISCLFFTIGIVIIFVTILSFSFLFRKMNASKQSNIERFNFEMLQYGIHNIKYPSSSIVTDINRKLIENYFSDQLTAEPGYRHLEIKKISIANRTNILSCPMVLTLQNLRVTFDSCPTCFQQRHRLLHHVFFNQTALRQPFNLIVHNKSLSIRISALSTSKECFPFL